MRYASAAVFGILGAASLATVAPVAAYADNSGGNGNGNGHSASAGSSSASAGGQAPAGNNGTIKVDEITMDSGQDNDAHVACGFSVSFFGFDAGDQSATVTVTPWAPTAGGKPKTYTISWHTATRTGGDQWDANVQVPAGDISAIFSGVSPKAQGFHARIEAEVTGSQGSDDKFKVVWIQGCANGSATSGATTPSQTGNQSQGGAPQGQSQTQGGASSPAAASVGASLLNRTPESSSLAPESSSPAPGSAPIGTSVLGETLVAPAAPAAGGRVVSAAGASAAPTSTSPGSVPAAVSAAGASPASSLPFTGRDIALEAAVAAALIGGGVALRRARRR
ncbi:MAG TPA: hypothetical protein VGR90_08075 [Acidimicrobiales bacterium]|nr:hypothetical protein [Acidimicrobiales bacterium]